VHAFVLDELRNVPHYGLGRWWHVANNIYAHS